MNMVDSLKLLYKHCPKQPREIDRQLISYWRVDTFLGEYFVIELRLYTEDISFAVRQEISAFELEEANFPIDTWQIKVLEDIARKMAMNFQGKK